MSFKNLNVPTDVQTSNDYLGGNKVCNSGVFKSTVIAAYQRTADSGAIGFAVSLKTFNGIELNETFWVTSGNAKGNKSYTERDGKKQVLPGYVLANDLCLLTVGTEISEIDLESKVINLYSAEHKKKVPTTVQMASELIGKEVLVGVIKQVRNKQAKGPDNTYVDIAETREENVIDKLFRESDGLTVSEILAEATEASFITDWTKRWDNQVRDRTSKTVGSTPSTGTAAVSDTPTTPTKKSLFGKK